MAMAASSASLSTFSSLSLNNNPSFHSKPLHTFFIPNTKPIKFNSIKANPISDIPNLENEDDLDAVYTFDPPERPEDFVEPPYFDDGPMEPEEEITRAYEELYGPAFSGESVLGNDIYELDSKKKFTDVFGEIRMEKIKDGLDERVVQVRRVSKVVKGGKQLHFRAVVVVGDRKGTVGVGVGNAKEVVDAVQKGAYNARRNLIDMPMTKYKTFPHRAEGDYGAARVMLRPAAPGSGVSAGGAVRIVLEMAGIENALGKQLGSNCALNNARATIRAVLKMRQFREVAEERGIPIEELWK